MSEKRKQIFVIIIGKDKKKSGIEKGIRGFLADTLSRHNDIGWEKQDLKDEIEDFLEKESFEEEDQRNIWIFRWNVVEELAIKLTDKKKEIYLNSGAFFFVSDLSKFSIPKTLKKPNYEHMGGISNNGKNYIGNNSNNNYNQNKKPYRRDYSDDDYSDYSDNDQRGSNNNNRGYNNSKKYTSNNNNNYRKPYNNNNNNKYNSSYNNNNNNKNYRGGYDSLYKQKQQLIALKNRNKELKEDYNEDIENMYNENISLKEQIQDLIEQLGNTKSDLKVLSAPLQDIDNYLNSNIDQQQQ